MKNETKAVSTRVTLRLAELIEEFCRHAYLNPADFIRDASETNCKEKHLSFVTSFSKRQLKIE